MNFEKLIPIIDEIIIYEYFIVHMNLFFLIIFLLSFCEFIGDWNLKKFARNNNYNDLFIGLIMYILIIFILIKCFQKSNLIYVNGLWDSISAVLTVSFAYIFLGERLSNKSQYIGIFLILCGIILLSSGNIPK
jgi:multidrug transporter EmrE-like cation transporter